MASSERVLLAVLNGDITEAERLIGDFTQRELREFENAIDTISNVISGSDAQ